MSRTVALFTVNAVWRSRCWLPRIKAIISKMIAATLSNGWRPTVYCLGTLVWLVTSTKTKHTLRLWLPHFANSRGAAMAQLCFPPAAVKTKQMSPQDKKEEYNSFFSSDCFRAIWEAAGDISKYLHKNTTQTVIRSLQLDSNIWNKQHYFSVSFLSWRKHNENTLRWVRPCLRCCQNKQSQIKYLKLKSSQAVNKE